MQAQTPEKAAAVASGSNPNAEHRLIHQSRPGDEQALDVLLEQHRPRLVAFCCRFVCPPQADGQDAAQEAIVRAATYRGAFRGEAEFSTWLGRIGVNACYDLLRRRERQGQNARSLTGAWSSSEEIGAAVPEPASPAPGPEQRAQDALLLQALRQRLDERSWQILVFSRDMGMTSPEIADLLDISAGRVRQILGHIRKVSQALWQEWNPQ